SHCHGRRHRHKAFRHTVSALFEDRMQPKLAKLIKLLQIVIATSALLGLCWVGYESMVYLRTAPRFEVRKLSVSGLKRVQENQVLAKAGFEVGTNVFRANLDE